MGRALGLTLLLKRSDRTGRVVVERVEEDGSVTRIDEVPVSMLRWLQERWSEAGWRVFDERDRTEPALQLSPNLPPWP